MADNVIVAEVHDKGHKIFVNWLIFEGDLKSPIKNESTRKDNIGRIILEYPTTDGIIVYFKDNSPYIQLNLENKPLINKQVKFIAPDQTEKIVSTNEELKAEFDAIL